MKKSLPFINPRRGFTLTELALVMGVIGTILGAVWWASANAHEVQRENTAVTEIQTVSQNIITLMQGHNLAPCNGGNDLTSCMIAAQAIPSNYVNPATPTLADNPWSPGNFIVTMNNAKSFHIAFYQEPYKGCLALLLQGTACQVGQVGCPTKVYTNATANSATPSTGWAVWSIGGATAGAVTSANTLCADNTYPGTNATNSVEFDFSL